MKIGIRISRSLVPGLNSISGVRGSELHRDRMEELISAVVGDGGETQDTTDRWGGRDISIESEAARTLRIQRKLDDLVEKENIFPEDPEIVTQRGLPPCKRVRKEG